MTDYFHFFQGCRFQRGFRPWFTSVPKTGFMEQNVQQWSHIWMSRRWDNLQSCASSSNPNQSKYSKPIWEHTDDKPDLSIPRRGGTEAPLGLCSWMSKTRVVFREKILDLLPNNLVRDQLWTIQLFNRTKYVMKQWSPGSFSSTGALTQSRWRLQPNQGVRSISLEVDWRRSSLTSLLRSVSRGKQWEKSNRATFHCRLNKSAFP